MLCGWFISPGPEPCVVPHALMNLPSFENFTTRPLAFATWPSVTKMSPLLRDDDVARSGERRRSFPPRRRPCRASSAPFRPG